MEDRGIGTLTLSRLINVSPITVERWLNGMFEPRQKNLVRITAALDISSDYLLGRTN